MMPENSEGMIDQTDDMRAKIDVPMEDEPLFMEVSFDSTAPDPTPNALS